MLFSANTRRGFKSEIELLITEAQTLSIASITKTLDGLKTRPCRKHILKSNIPIAFVSGKRDDAIALKSLKDQHSAKAVKKVWLTKHGHMGHIEYRDFCLIAIQEFLA